MEQTGANKRDDDDDDYLGAKNPVLLSGSARASPIATAGYFLIVAGHVWLLRVHALATGVDGRLFATLAAVEFALAFEALVFALGAWGRSCSLSLLTVLGRVRLLGAAIAWPWLVPWVSELSCRCNVVSKPTGVMLLHHSLGAALLISCFFLLSEVSFLIRGEPAATFGKPSSGGDCVPDCLPSQAVLGGQFRLDKADLEETGRVVFVPARPRQGLYIGSGLAMLANLIFGFTFLSNAPFPPWLLLGAVSALSGRWFGQLPKFKGREEGSTTADSTLVWRREAPRLACRLGELLWIGCCILEVQRCESSAAWLATCEL